MLRFFAFALMLAPLAIGQSEKAALRFEVCDLQPSKINDPSLMKAEFLPGGRVDVRGISLKDIIAAVYKVGPDLVSGPSWMASDRYDIIAKAPPTSTEEQLYEMGRTMLAERFQMVSHEEKKTVPVYALIVGKKGAKITAASDPHARDKTTFHDVICPAVPSDPGDPPGMLHRDCHAVTMADLATMIPQVAPAYFHGLPVVDLTGLQGTYDLKLDWMILKAYNAAISAAPGSAPADSRAVSIFDAVERLGLQLENRKYPMDAVVVDSLLRTPVGQ